MERKEASRKQVRAHKRIVDEIAYLEKRLKKFDRLGDEKHHRGLYVELKIGLHDLRRVRAMLEEHYKF